MINHFSSGNVYVIDDFYEEAKPIIDSLYKLQIPHIYSDGSKSNLPSSQVQVRLIFLDLNLKPSQNPDDKKSFKNMHASILNQLLENNSSSYIILIWSKEADTRLNDFMEVIDETEYNLSHRKPLEIIILDKNEYFSQSNNDKGESMFSWIDGKEGELFALIESHLNKNEAFKILSSWETLIKKSGSRTVDYLFELASFDNGQNVNENLKHIISKLSISVLGYKNFKSLDNQGKTDGFMLSLSELIDDEIDKDIILNTQKPEFTNWVNPILSPEFIYQLNTKLLISKDTRKKELTGSILKSRDADHDFSSLFYESIDISKEGKIIEELNANNEGKSKESKIKLEDFINDKYSVNRENDFVIPIELNLTPLCDIVQKKEKYYRLVPGFLLNVELKDYLLKSTDRNYVSPPIFVENYNSNYIIVLDYRYLHSFAFLKLDELEKIFTLRKNFVDDIQLKLSNHVSRLGVLNL
jgi:hypothetical protein